MNVISQKDFSCGKCGTTLTEDNWTPSLKKSHHLKCRSCYNKHQNEKNNPRINKQRMFVNGKYVPKSHPLHKAGRYKSFGDAAFSSLQKDKKIKEGYVYAIVNPAWPDWIKIGMAIDAEDRLNGYQTSSPMRDYTLIYSVFSKNRGKDERKAHKLAEKVAERRGEWFKIPQDKAINILKELSDG